MRNHRRDLLNKQSKEKAETEREPLKNLQSSTFLHKSYSTHTGYVYYNQMNQISNQLLQHDQKQKQRKMMISMGHMPDDVKKRDEKQKSLIKQRELLKETQNKILEYHLEQMEQAAKD